jgi:hypothetical protein
MNRIIFSAKSNGEFRRNRERSEEFSSFRSHFEFSRPLLKTGSPNPNRRFQEQHIGLFVPREMIVGKFATVVVNKKRA